MERDHRGCIWMFTNFLHDYIWSSYIYTNSIFIAFKSLSFHKQLSIRSLVLFHGCELFRYSLSLIKIQKF